jgi:dipeptidyl aminopeptidase/acylaminoacyl peptidase
MGSMMDLLNPKRQVRWRVPRCAFFYLTATFQPRELLEQSLSTKQSESNAIGSRRAGRLTVAAIALGASVALATPTRALQSPIDPSAMHHEIITSAAMARQQIEYFWIAPKGMGPWPAIVLIHGHQDGQPTPGGKAFVDYGVLDTLAAEGYVAISVSQPGYGHSDGPADFMGPRTIAAVETVLQHFREQPFVRRDRIGLEGVSRGAIVASLVAAQDTTIRAMVLISGAYDFLAPLDSSTVEGRANIGRRNQIQSDIASETDGSMAALRARSPLLLVKQIRTPTLLMNGAQDDRTDPEQARSVADGIRHNGVFARAVIYPSLGHAIPYELREHEIRPFFREYLR